MWIKVEEELPIQSFLVRARNGKRIVDAIYYRKKWYSAHDYDVWGFGEPRQVRLHKVTEWYKCPVVYPKIPPKDFKAFLKRSEKYRDQMQSKKMIFGPIFGIHRFPPLTTPVSDKEAIENLKVFAE